MYSVSAVSGSTRLRFTRRAHDAGADVARMDVETRREVHLVEEVPEPCDPLAVELDVVEVLS